MEAKTNETRFSRRALIGGIGAGVVLATVGTAGVAAAEALGRGPRGRGVATADGAWRGFESPQLAVATVDGVGRGFESPQPMLAQPAASDPLSAEAIGAITEAIVDEYRARATYEAVIAKFGSVRPFSNIVKSEETHIAALVTIFNSYGIPVPADPHRGNVTVPSTLKECCQLGVQAEIENYEIYERLLLLEVVKQRPDIVQVFNSLHDASEEKHLPAFERCA